MRDRPYPRLVNYDPRRYSSNTFALVTAAFALALMIWSAMPDPTYAKKPEAPIVRLMAATAPAGGNGLTPAPAATAPAPATGYRDQPRPRPLKP